MADLVVIVPSRGRPEAVRDLYKVFQETCVLDTRLLVAVDDDDPTKPEYATAAPMWLCSSRNMGQALNQSAVAVASHGFEEPQHVWKPVFAIGFMGDDHRPRTVGWDKAYVEALRDLGSGIVYGNDLLQGERLPTQVAMTSDIIRALGYMAPTSLVHLYFDNFWLDLGKAAGCIRYLPDVVVEHCHPIAGKAKWDEGYRRVNNSAMYERDEAAYLKYRAEQFDTDVATVRALRGGA